jgi:GNAT superfamily N-acetyltransferase
LELTEFFIRPSEQARGVGRALLEHAFPRGQYQQSLIISTLDQRAQACYLQARTYPITPVYTFGGTPHVNGVTTDLDFEPIQAAPKTLETLAKIDTLILGHRRDEDHE